MRSNYPTIQNSYIRFKYVFVFLIFISTSFLFAQEGGCATEAPANPPVIQNYPIIPKTIQFYFHIIRDDFRQGGHTNQQVDE